MEAEKAEQIPHIRNKWRQEDVDRLRETRKANEDMIRTTKSNRGEGIKQTATDQRKCTTYKKWRERERALQRDAVLV